MLPNPPNDSGLALALASPTWQYAVSQQLAATLVAGEARAWVIDSFIIYEIHRTYIGFQVHDL